MTHINNTIMIDNFSVSNSILDRYLFGEYYTNTMKMIEKFNGKYPLLKMYLKKVCYVSGYDNLVYIPSYDIASIVEDIEDYCDDEYILETANYIKNFLLAETKTNDGYNEFLLLKQ